MPKWEWDQGRTAYFDYANVRKMAQALTAFRGAPTRLRTSGQKRVAKNADPLSGLRAATGLSFRSGVKGHTIWRNYGRIFKALLLAANPSNTLAVTDACTWIEAGNPNGWTADEYFAFLIPRTYMKSPARRGYTGTGPVVYPICALIRFLLARSACTIDELMRYVVGNGCVGNEQISYYFGLHNSGHRDDTEERQVREMVKMFSQASYLDWDGTHVSLSLGPSGSSMNPYLLSIASPMTGAFLSDSDDEVMRLGKVIVAPTLSSGVATQPFGLPAVPQGGTAPGAPPLPNPTSGYEGDDDRQFTEGKKRRIEHLRTERSARLKREYVKKHGQPAECDICGVRPLKNYPWLHTPNIQLHHKLPLASSVHTTLTSLSDVVPLCGTCHTAVHQYYSIWLNGNAQDDFSDKTQAHVVYDQARSKYRP